MTSPWAAVQSSALQSPQSPYRWILLAAVILLAVMLGGGAVAFLYRMNSWDLPTVANTSQVSPARPETKAPKTKQEQSDPSNVEPAPAKAPNLSGEWNMVNTIETTSYPQYKNLRLGYHLVISQTGTEFTGEGEKLSENGTDMDASEQTPIHVPAQLTRMQ
jgi:hypothetical protein